MLVDPVPHPPTPLQRRSRDCGGIMEFQKKKKIDKENADVNFYPNVLRDVKSQQQEQQQPQENASSSCDENQITRNKLESTYAMIPFSFDHFLLFNL